MLELDTSKRKFDEFISFFNQFKDKDITESDTRSKLLDKLLIEVLGWTEKDIDREGHTSAGYYDYFIAAPNFKFVLEAKRNFNEIKLPKNSSKHVTLNSLYKENEKVINQIRGYLFEVDLQYGIISNGRQYIIGKFINDTGEPWKKNKIVFFDGIDDIQNRFIDFYNILSRNNVIENNGFSVLDGETIFAKTMLSTIPKKDSEVVRNSFSSKLTPLINKIFGEIYKYETLDNSELIKECFVENVEIKKNRSEIEELFADLPPDLNEVVPARNINSIAKQIEGEIQKYPVNLEETEPPYPIIIIGSKGSGKTTFINYLFKSSVSDDFDRSRPNIYIDFRKYVDNDLEELNKKIFKDLILSIEKKYSYYKLHTLKTLKKVYRNEIRKKDESTWIAFKKNIESYEIKLSDYLESVQLDYENHFIKLSEYFINERKQRLCVIIDNADQFDFSVQKTVFLFAQSLRIKSKSAVIISLREGYYYKWRYKPPFDAFKSNVYHITAPPYNLVLQKRINYTIKTLSIKGNTKGQEEYLNIEFNNKNILDFFLNLNKTLFIRENSEMLQFLESTTYPNIREGLDLFDHFLRSGHTDITKYILRQQTEEYSKQPIPIWEFIKAVALDNKKYYNHENSKIHNLFYPVGNSSLIFLKFKILNVLNSRLVNHGVSEKFYKTANLIAEFVENGYKDKIVYKELLDLLSYGLIETEDMISDSEEIENINNNNSISITLKGQYYIKVLVTKFSYISLVLQDTLIFDKDVFAQMAKTLPKANDKGKRSLTERYEVANIFINYLKAQEVKELGGNESKNIMEDILNNGLLKSMSRVKKRIKVLGLDVKTS